MRSWIGRHPCQTCNKILNDRSLSVGNGSSVCKALASGVQKGTKGKMYRFAQFLGVSFEASDDSIVISGYKFAWSAFMIP